MRIVSLMPVVAGFGAMRSARAAALLAAIAIAQPGLALAQKSTLPKGAAGPTAEASTDTLVSLKQMTVTIDPAGDAKANGDRIAAFQSATLGIFSCEDVAGVAQSTGASVKDAADVPLVALPPALRTVVATMKVGTATQLFGDRAEGQVKVLVLCDRH